MPVLSAQEEMISDSVTAVLNHAGGLARVRELSAGDTVPVQRVFRAAGEQGWIGLLVPEAYGGLGLDVRDALVLMRTAGRFLVPEPLAIAIATARILAELGGAEELLSRAIGGAAVVLAAPAFARNGGLESAMVQGIGCADVVLLIEPTGSIHVVDRSDPDLRMQLWKTRDGGAIGRATLRLDNKASKPKLTAAYPVELVRLLQAAELSGLGAEAFDRTLAYLETRRQFGVPLANFQVLQHRAASIHVANAAAEAVLFEAARAFDGPTSDLASRTAWRGAMAAAELACKEAIQLHGAIGIAEECDIGLFFRRFLTIVAAQRAETIRLSAG